MSSPSDTSKPDTSVKPPDQGNMETIKKNDDWKNVTEERKKGKTGSKTPSPDTMEAVNKPKKLSLKKRNPADLHSVSSEISARLQP
jgi:hypothetical protein